MNAQKNRQTAYKYTIKFIFLNALLLLIQSCSPLYYVPNQPNMPMFRGGGEGKASFKVSSPLLGEVDNAFEGQVSASVINHLGFVANGFIASGNNNSNSNDDYSGRGHVWELGAGYFNMVDNKWGFDFFAGAGKGAVTLFKGSSMFFESGISRWYVQPSIYYSSKHFETGIAFRVSNVHYVDARYRNYTPDADDVLTTTNALFYEPSVFFAFGGPLVKGHVQCTPSFFVSNARDFNREKFMLSIGIDFIINRKYNNNKSSTAF